MLVNKPVKGGPNMADEEQAIKIKIKMKLN